jgi:hypothetical protein
MTVHLVWPNGRHWRDTGPAESPHQAAIAPSPAEPAPVPDDGGEALLNPDAIIPPPTSRRRMPPATPPAA